MECILDIACTGARREVEEHPMSDTNLVRTKPIMGTGGLAVPLGYRPLRNSGATDLWFDWWAQQIAQRFGDLGAPNAGPHLQGFEQFTVPDWDGQEAAPVAKADLDFARRLLTSIEPYLPSEPDAAPGADGSICMEWISDTAAQSKKIFVDVAPRGYVLTYSRLGDSPPLERHFTKNDPALMPYLRHLFEFFLTTPAD
jgi:hypothetical protein